MKTFTVYLDTRTGRSQVTFDAERYDVTEDSYVFYAEDQQLAVFSRERTFGVVEERHRDFGWEERPPEAG